MLPRHAHKSEQAFLVDVARASLREKGYSIRRAAQALGYSESHFTKVIYGIHQSEVLLNRVFALPQSDIPFRNSGFARKGVKCPPHKSR